jgi:hypothetical protein
MLLIVCSAGRGESKPRPFIMFETIVAESWKSASIKDIQTQTYTIDADAVAK